MIDKSKFAKLKSVAVAVPEWEVTVQVRELSAGDRAALMKKVNKEDPLPGVVHLVIATVHDDEGKKLFTEADFDEVSSYSAAVLDRLAVVAGDMCGISQKAVEDEKKDSAPTTN